MLIFDCVSSGPFHHLFFERISSQDRLAVLQQWVNSGENAKQCEAALVLERRSLQRVQGNEELLTIQAMFERKIPIEKIRAVVSRGGGIPDKDAPGVAKLTSFWIETSRTRTNREDMSQTARLQVNAQASGALDVMGMALENAPSSARGGQPDIEALVAQAQSSVAPSGEQPAGRVLLRSLVLENICTKVIYSTRYNRFPLEEFQFNSQDIYLQDVLRKLKRKARRKQKHKQ